MDTASSNSSKHKDIIAKSFEISPGSPTVYQIGTQNQNFRTVTRKTVGEKDPNRRNKTILLVGETGSGKSTLINVLLNYTMGVKFEDNVWFEIVEDDKRNHTESQMSDVIVYEIFGFEDQTFPYSFTIIDTPGYESTRGIEHDLLISQKLSDLLRSENGIHELHAVCLVLKASDRKLSYQVRYNFDSLLSLFGEDIENRTVVVITHSGGKTTTNVLKAIKNKNFKCAVNDNNEPVCFQFENCQREQRTDKTIKALQNAWDLTKEGLDQFTCFLDKSGKASQNLKPNITNLNVHIRLTACVHNLQERLKLVDLQQQKLKQTQEVLKKYEEQKENNKELFVDVDEVYKVKETIKGGKWWLLFSNQAVCCTICEENCHYPGCTRAQSPADCEIMRNGKCTSCTGECPASAHVKENWRFVFNKRRVNKSLTEVRETYEKESSENERKVTLMEIIRKQMEALSEQKSKLLEESCQHIVNLEQIALKGHSLSTLIHLDFVSEKMRETGHTMRLQELENIRSLMDDTIRAVLHHRFINTSEYSDIISTSSLMRSGSPAVYQLTPTIENIGTLTRKAVGKKNQWQKHKAILLVGETGAGKSSLINTLLNYTMGVTFEDNIWLEVVEREKRRKSSSQTLDVVVYEIFGFKDQTLPYSLTIIDTPGYGSTEGIESDLHIRQRLLDLFCSEDGVHELHAVCLVLKASDNKVTDRFRYIIDSVTSLFGKNMKETIVPLITHSNGTTPNDALQALEDANIICVENEENQPVHFLFDNTQTTERTQANNASLKNAWDNTERAVSAFTDYVESCKPQMLITTVEVLKSRIAIAACINNLQERIVLIDLKQNEIQETKDALNKNEQKMKDNVNFIITVDEPYKDKEPIDSGLWGLILYQGAVCCTVCKENCHYPGCTMAWYPGQCEVMTNGRCTVCSGKCPASVHVKESWKYVTKKRKVHKTLDDVKLKYDQNKTQKEKKLSLLENLEKEMNDLTSKKNQLLEESYQLVVKLEQIALSVNSLSTHVHLDVLIEKMKETGEAEKVQKLEEMRSKRDITAIAY